MNDNTDRLKRLLTRSRTMSDYDLWRASQTLNDELHRIERHGGPIPITLLQIRKALREARRRLALKPASP